MTEPLKKPSIGEHDCIYDMPKIIRGMESNIRLSMKELLQGELRVMSGEIRNHQLEMIQSVKDQITDVDRRVDQAEKTIDQALTRTTRLFDYKDGFSKRISIVETEAAKVGEGVKTATRTAEQLEEIREAFIQLQGVAKVWGVVVSVAGLAGAIAGVFALLR